MDFTEIFQNYLYSKFIFFNNRVTTLGVAQVMVQPTTKVVKWFCVINQLYFGKF